MDLNKIILKVGLLLVALSFIFGMGISYYLKLDNPVFLEIYKDIYQYKNEGENVYNVEDFSIQYLTNNTDNRRVVDIYFKEAPDLDFIADEYGFGGFFPMFGPVQNQGPGKTYGRYSLRSIYIKLDKSVPYDLGGIQLQDAVITYNNGDTIDVNIGRIILKEGKDKDDGLSRDGASGSSDGTGSSNYQVQRDIILEKLDSPFLENIKNNIEITVGGKDYKDISGMKYKTGDRFTINSYFKTPDDIILKYTLVDFDLDLYFKDIEGNMHNTRAHFIHYQPYDFNTNTWDIISYLRKRGEI